MAHWEGCVVPHTPPRFEKYSIEVHRLESFKDKSWPIGLTQSPEELANAGFYYLGIRDQVMCFYCEGGLQNWEPNDDPWEEHTKHFPRCGYMNLMKSQPNVQHDQQYVHHSSNRNLKFHNSHSYPSESSECSGTATSIIEWQTPTTSLEVQLPIQRSKDDDKVMLQQENEILREAGLCKICADKELGVVFIPCGHLVSCRNCKASLANCPICRRIINSFMKIYYS